MLPLSLLLSAAVLPSWHDCNANGSEDSVDIATGTSFDCNGNGVPDECDVGTTFDVPGPRFLMPGARGNCSAVADFDGDGRNDVALGTNAGFTVWHGEGDGRFTQISTAPIDVTIRIAAGDVDLDGDLDLASYTVSLNAQGPKYRVHLNDGTGHFIASQVFPNPTGSVPYEVLLRDVDNDLDADLIASGEFLDVFRNTGGTFAYVTSYAPGFPTPGSVTTDVTVADFDQDGDLDMIATSPFVGALFLYRNAGNGTFVQQPGPALPAPASVQGVTHADVNGDGFLDLVVVASNTNTVTILLGTAGGTFVPTSATSSLLSQKVRTLDVDHDGDLDIVVNTTLAAQTLRNDGGGVFIATPVVALGNFLNAANLPLRGFGRGDVTGDGFEDLLWCSDNVVVYESSTDGGLATPEWHPINAQSAPIRSSLVPGDFDGDGREDLLSIETTSCRVLWNTGPGQFIGGASNPLPVVANFKLVNPLATDVDLDGDLDVLSSVNACWLINLGNGSFFPIASWSTTPSHLSTSRIVDFDSDGDPDIVGAFTSSNRPWIYRNQGSGVFTHQQFAATWPSPSVYAEDPGSILTEFGDFDGDGNMDLVGASRFPGTPAPQIMVYRGSAAGTVVTATTPLNAPGTVSAIACADFDGDGDVDLFVSTRTPTVALSLYRNTGSGAFAAPVVMPLAMLTAQGTFPLRLTAEDLDRDGDIDLLAHQTDSILFLANTGAGALAARRWIPAIGAPSANVRDFDLDQRPEIVLLDRNTSETIGDVVFARIDSHPAASADCNKDLVPDECQSTGFSFCFGDGSGSACPCGNTSAPGSGAGCANAQGTGGRLADVGIACVSLDQLRLRVEGLPATAPVLLFQGTQQVVNGAGAVFGDGLRCAGGIVTRLGVRAATAGTVDFPAPGAPPISVAGSIPATGGGRFYQAWYRDAIGACASTSGFNLSQGLRLTWIP